MTETTARRRKKAAPRGLLDQDVPEPTDMRLLTAPQLAKILQLKTSTVTAYYREGIIRPFISDKKSPRFNLDWAIEDLKKLNRK